MDFKAQAGYDRRGFLSFAAKGSALLLLSGCSATQYVTLFDPYGRCTTQAPTEAQTGDAEPSPQTAAPPCPVMKPEDYSIHEVAPMETVPRLAQTYGVGEDAILDANGLKPGEPLEAGRKLLIPRPTRYKNIVPVFQNDRWQYIVIHHTAGEYGKALLVDKMHRERGFSEGLGYHFLIDNGTLEKGNGQLEVAPRWIKQEVGAHCKAGGMNEVGIGISLVGNFNDDLPSPAQLLTLSKLVSLLGSYYDIPPSRVLGHRQVPGAKTDCPGKRFPWKQFCQRLEPLSTPSGS